MGDYKVMYGEEVVKEGKMEECFDFADGIIKCIGLFNKQVKNIDESLFVARILEKQVNVVRVEEGDTNE